ncbi:hypothetical protein FA95DRAFT_1354949 [Auriscalpium vulgare]|uniref:Uncharacterized protein n=1 Tax=Auriscalpium vulgare TaxID=40419 RepID=A0ACB8RRI7_9AGAM|nr:hypothetical protein FA95DRAFT_1354949 [Auriscalpium vulgare]
MPSLTAAFPCPRESHPVFQPARTHRLLRTAVICAEAIEPCHQLPPRAHRTPSRADGLVVARAPRKSLLFRAPLHPARTRKQRRQHRRMPCHRHRCLCDAMERRCPAAGACAALHIRKLGARANVQGTAPVVDIAAPYAVSNREALARPVYKAHPPKPRQDSHLPPSCN